MLARVAFALALVGCWAGHPTSGPPRWRNATVPEVLPDGAWLVAALDIADDSPGQREKEAKARRDPKDVRSGDGCQFPSTHLAFGVYGRGDIIAASRGVYRRDAILECIADLGRTRGSTVTNQTVRGVEVLELRSSTGSFLVTATDSGMILGTSGLSLMTRALADDLAPATADAKLGPLIRDARARGELWLAAVVPRGSSVIDDALAWIGARPAGRVVSLVGAIHLQAPQRIDLTVGVESDADARLLATALEQRRRAFRSLASPDLQPLLDAVSVVAEGSRVRIVGSPVNLDWWKTFRGLASLIAKLRS